MIIRDGEWSVVVPGHWNKYILNPAWVGQNLFKEDNIKVEYPVNNPDFPPRYVSSENIIFIPANHRITFLLQDPFNDSVMEKISIMMKNLIEALPHTPIAGVGINNSFELPTSEFEQLELFQLSDADGFSEINCDIKVTEVKRQFTSDGKTINLSIINNNEVVIFDFNYHFEISSSEDAVTLFSNENILKEARDKSINVLKSIYNLTIEDEEE